MKTIYGHENAEVELLVNNQLKCFEVELGIFNNDKEQNSPIESFVLVFTHLSFENLSSVAIAKATELLKKPEAATFKPLSAPKEVNVSSYLSNNNNQVTISSAKLQDKRLHRFAYSGVLLKFSCAENIKRDTIIQLDAFEPKAYFSIQEIEIVDDNYLYTCTQTGYWANALERKEDFDLKSIIGATATIVEDKKTIANVRAAAQYT